MGYLGNGGAIKDLTLGETCSVTGGEYVGGICGYNVSGTIESCTNAGAVTGSRTVGGICGYNNSGAIESCTNAGSVTNSVALGSSHVGGICGRNNNAAPSKAAPTRAVSPAAAMWAASAATTSAAPSKAVPTRAMSPAAPSPGSSNVGGICGYNNSGCTVANCYWLGTAYTGNGIGTDNGTSTGVEQKTADQFASGEVCWLLNGSTSEGTLAWYQNLDNDQDKDTYPRAGQQPRHRLLH